MIRRQCAIVAFAGTKRTDTAIAPYPIHDRQVLRFSGNGIINDERLYDRSGGLALPAQ